MSCPNCGFANQLGITQCQKCGRLLAVAPIQPQQRQQYWGMDERTFCMLLHISQFASVIVPLAGFVLPIVMWATEKDKSRSIDLHGKIVINWIISCTIYAIVAAILIIVVIGIPILIALVVVGIVFPIMGGIKANKGEFWKYPLSITFLKP